MALETQFDIQKALEEIDKVPTLPKIVYKIISMISDSKVSLSSISKVIEEDPPLVARILKEVNSGCYQIPFRISDVNQATVLLGLTELRNLVFELSLHSNFYHIKKSRYFSFNKFWKHSAGTAKLASAICKHLSLNFEQADFVGGLLHDFGRLILHFYFQSIYEKVFQYSIENQLSLHKAEKDCLNFTHAQAGYWLANRWRLPRDVTEVMRHHHQIIKEDVHERPLLAIVYVADRITNINGFTLEPNPLDDNIDEDPIWKELQKVYPKISTFPLEEMNRLRGYLSQRYGAEDNTFNQVN
ncbi:MAG: HDOD domain-containing protein [Calditrichae bacterium]|nr:HDOD domain-containing protein [Calditrichia bacterium]